MVFRSISFLKSSNRQGCGLTVLARQSGRWRSSGELRGAAARFSGGSGADGQPRKTLLRRAAGERDLRSPGCAGALASSWNKPTRVTRDGDTQRQCPTPGCSPLCELPHPLHPSNAMQTPAPIHLINSAACYLRDRTGLVLLGD